MPLIVKNAAFATALVVKPSLTVWSRLEVQPTTSDYAPALAAGIADPLWMLARQWQFGEFGAEDAGSPIAVKLKAEEAGLARYFAGPLGRDPASEATDYDPVDQPLETLVEAESPELAGPLAGVWAGQQFLRLLVAAGLSDGISGVADYAFAEPAAVDRDVDAQGADWVELAALGTIDGHKLAAAIAKAGGLPQGVGNQAGLKELCLEWLDWYRGGLPPERGSAWLANRLEYGFAASTGKGAGKEDLLVAEEYADGKLDWYSFDLADAPSLGGTRTVREIKFNPMLPTSAHFGGMPSDRFWAFEDGKVNLAQVSAGPTDIGRLLMLEFALAFSNDWFVIPVELPIGSLFRIKEFTVTDTFGVTSPVGRASDAAGVAWRMFELSRIEGARSDAFLLAPVIDARLEGDPLEDVALFRDEMANMAWAVERKVPGVMGLPVDRYQEAAKRSAAQQFADLSDVTAELVYRVSTSVPEHWLPLVPIPKGDRPLAEFGIELERRAMLRHLDDGSIEPIYPHGVLLRTDLTKNPADEPAQRLEDEEVPREGVVVTRKAQFARWIGGERLHWIGRNKTHGKGEGASGLRHDIRVRKDQLPS
ncbi:MAG: hypothetical protein JWR51_4457 [Devosia sp.]|uniref:hypothetical protein n=1 Tax=Devosia sp. TaxID=1871048 RepID=UPI00262E1A5B|nr:hypothetical protein [Devosia sp.]MDB5531354.1 hypothetical protein [Devosia sp.]